MAFPNIKPIHVIIAFGFGALSTLVASWASLALMLNTFPVLMPLPFQNDDLVAVLMAVIVAPFAEELAKPIGLYFMHSEEKPKLELNEWAFLGAMAGLGFAIVENILYASSAMAYGGDAALMLTALRFLLPLHMVATAISGFGFGLWTKTGKSKYFVACIFVSMLLHGAYNLAATMVG
ncbi:MAG: PrsW family intramembrane metalloprotease [Candidatus Thermoplasmatota archaeon]|nr:PrsW family intramembrane metalloprotease [Euryarchaeota archaeon]MBU4032387.1 PrsW family intramembrane metalloprotease [Candidatus Thermoplasmatota archaeon]MBU4071124.1 PrsW family intramembrane metalloprotease [Candidatus Thermoplasmatota archaeon]MBU4144812.1 PrsW family intramembrane metalloprotease [Candidatus Thermoplasmatota archaeon]MBU4591618.1 PrsW family intramembrane metalloprotease [Candidatus Thermoplasmatota archaeon]